MNDTPEFTMTVEEMREVDERIDALCALADRLWMYDPDDDMTTSWLGHWEFIKPIMTDLVGWERDRARIGLTYPVLPRGGTIQDIILHGRENDPRPPAETDVDRFLRTEVAWRLILNYVTRQ